jgi:hypothetical protein
MKQKSPDLSAVEIRDINAAAFEIFEICRELRSPREAAAAISLAHVLVLEQGTNSEALAAEAVSQSSAATLKIYRQRQGLKQ